MKRIVSIKILASLFALIIILTGCSSKTIEIDINEVTKANPETKGALDVSPEASDDNITKKDLGGYDVSKLNLKKYDDIASFFMPADGIKTYDDIVAAYQDLRGSIFEKHQYKPEDIFTYNFDSTIIFKGSEALAAKILEEGKDPGLGIRNLHHQGITGKGVNVAIIDQHLLTDHPEYAGRIVAYYDAGCNRPEDEGSYHGAAVTSILGGKTTGVAPEVNIYYAAAPGWERDAKYFADSLYWIIEQNKALPESEKIRIVSVSASPSSSFDWYKNGELWEEAVQVAQKDGIMIIDCRTFEDTDIVFSSYLDLSDKDNVTKSTPGYPVRNNSYYVAEDYRGMVFAPASYRTVAQQYKKGEYDYRYDAMGGQSWAVPYVSGVLALGWQVNPKLDWETMKALLFQTSWVDEPGRQFVNPPAFIEAVGKAK